MTTRPPDQVLLVNAHIQHHVDWAASPASSPSSSARVQIGQSQPLAPRDREKFAEEFSSVIQEPESSEYIKSQVAARVRGLCLCRAPGLPFLDAVDVIVFTTMAFVRWSTQTA